MEKKLESANGRKLMKEEHEGSNADKMTDLEEGKRLAEITAENRGVIDGGRKRKNKSKNIYISRNEDIRLRNSKRADPGMDDFR